MSTEYVFEKAMEEKTTPQSIISEKYYLDLNDQNQGNYANQQLQFDCSSLGLQDAECSLADSIIRIPYQITVSSTTDLNAANRDLVALKGNFTSIVDAMQIMIDNKVIKQFSSHSEIPAHFKLLTTMAKDYETVAAGTLNHALDVGFITFNNGMGERQVGNTAVADKCARLSHADDSVYLEDSSITNRKKSHYVKTSSKIVTYNYLIEIPLKDLDPIFESIPLSRGLYLKLNMQMHAGSCVFKSTAKVISEFTSNTAYGVLPFYINDAILDSTNGILASAGAGTVTIQAGISKNALAAASNPILNTCQLHACFYKPRASEEQSLRRRGVVEINYLQQMLQYHQNVLPRKAFQFQISSSSSRTAFLLIHTRLSDKINMGNDATATSYTAGNTLVASSTMASPFTSSPFTTKYYSSLTQFQINIGGVPLFTRGALNFDYDMWNENFRAFNSLNGGQDKYDCSGLISREMWEKGYGYTVIDLRKYESYANWTLPKDISISAVNNSPNMCDYQFFLFEEKDFKLNTSTGEVLV